MHKRRTVQESLRLLPRHAIKPFVPRRMILGPKLRNQVRHSRARNGGLEHSGLRDRPFRHVSAVRPSANPQPVRICDAALHQILHSRHHILVIAPAPIAAIRFDEFLSVSHRPANVRIKHRVSVRRQELPPRLDGVPPASRRPAVDQRNQRQLYFAIGCPRLQQRRFYFRPIKRLVLEKFRFTQRVLLPGIVQVRHLSRRALLVPYPDLLWLRRALRNKRDLSAGRQSQTPGSRWRWRQIMSRSIRRVAHQRIGKAVRREQNDRAIFLPMIILHGTVQARPRKISRRVCRHRQQHQIVRIWSVFARPDVADRLPIRRSANFPKWPARRHKLLHRSIRNLHAIDSFRVLVRLRTLRAFHDHPATGWQPGQFIEVPVRLRQRPRFAGCNVQNPQPRALVIFIHHARVVFVFLLLLFFLGLYIRREERDARAIRRPFERLNAALPLGDRPAFSPVRAHQENLLLVLVAIRKKRQLLPVRRPSRHRLRFRRKRKLPSRATLPLINPSVPRPFGSLRRLRNHKRQAPTIRRKLQLRNRPESQRRLRRKQSALIGRCRVLRRHCRGIGG